MRDDRPLNAEARTILRHATVADLKCDAAALAELVRAVRRPLPMLPLDPAERERTLMMALSAKDGAARWLLALIAGDVVAS